MKENQERKRLLVVRDGRVEQRACKSYLQLLSVTERYANQHQANEERLELLSCAVTQTRDSVFITDHSHRILFVNQAFSRSFGYGEGEMLGRGADLLFAGGLLELSEDGGVGGPLEVMHVRKDGTEFLAATSRSMICRTDGQPSAYVYVTRDMTARQQAEASLQRRIRQQAVVAVLGQRALRGQDVGSLMDCATHLIAEVLEIDLCGVLELLPGGAEFLLRSATGWQPWEVGVLRIPADQASYPGCTLHSREAVIVEDLRTEKRFAYPEVLRRQRVVSGLSVMIRGEGQAYGVLDVQASRRRAFSREDVYFLEAIANVLASAIQRANSEREQKRLIKELQGALASVRTLSGLLPICCQCKKIRDDQGYWSAVENYLSRHSSARFTHGLCPDCYEKVRQGLGAAGDAEPAPAFCK